LLVAQLVVPLVALVVGAVVVVGDSHGSIRCGGNNSQAALCDFVEQDSC